ncbi:hypothetical protein [Embleya scabrispora]|uniref:hypothetical protein n=1 Tax=Embleya scabrispora TaxID=159449 RepID=UPI00117CFA0D|nr:hypothetical protein [Embleya scabrispora]
MADTTRILVGGPLDGGEVELTVAEHEGIGGVYLHQADATDDQVHHYEPGENPGDGRLYYEYSIR